MPRVGALRLFTSLGTLRLHTSVIAIISIFQWKKLAHKEIKGMVLGSDEMGFLACMGLTPGSKLDICHHC